MAKKIHKLQKLVFCLIITLVISLNTYAEITPGDPCNDDSDCPEEFICEQGHCIADIPLVGEEGVDGPGDVDPDTCNPLTSCILMGYDGAIIPWDGLNCPPIGTAKNKCQRHKIIDGCCCKPCDDKDYKCFCKTNQCREAQCAAKNYKDYCCPNIFSLLPPGIPRPNIHYVCTLKDPDNENGPEICGLCNNCETSYGVSNCRAKDIFVNICKKNCRNICGILFHELLHWLYCYTNPGATSICDSLSQHITMEQQLYSLCKNNLLPISNDPICKLDCNDHKKYICPFCNDYKTNNCPNNNNITSICNLHHCGTSPSCLLSGCQHKAKYNCCSRCNNGTGCCENDSDCIGTTCDGATGTSPGDCK